MEQDVSSKLNEIFRKVFKDNALQIRDEMTTNDVERWDSLSHLGMIATVEKEFGIKFRLKELVAMKDVGDLRKSIEEKLNK